MIQKISFEPDFASENRAFETAASEQRLCLNKLPGGFYVDQGSQHAWALWIHRSVIAGANAQADRDQVMASFKNFHRSLCARFGYYHDDIDWQRDQVSLEEHIATQFSHVNAENGALRSQVETVQRGAGQLKAENEVLSKGTDRDQRIQCAMAEAMAEVGEALGIMDQQGGAEEQVEAVKQLNSIIEDLERARISGFEEYDFSRLNDLAGDQKVFEITIETECGCDIEEGEYTVRVTHLLGNWLGSDDFGLIGDAVAEVIADLGLPEEGHTTFIAYESGERQDVFWTKWFEIATVASVLAEPGAAMGKGEQS